MTADVELLPLPEWTKRDDAGQNMVPSEIRVSMADYARANVAHATAAKDAEIEALRAEVERLAEGWAAQSCRADRAEARAERLAEALRGLLVPGLRVYKGSYVVQIDAGKSGLFTERYDGEADYPRALRAVQDTALNPTAAQGDEAASA